MLSWLACRRAPMARLRRLAIARGAEPVRTREASSANVVSRTWWSRFSIPQWPRTHEASSAGAAWRGRRLVTPSAARTVGGASATHSEIAARDFTPARTAQAASARTKARGWRRPADRRGSGTAARRRSSPACAPQDGWRRGGEFAQADRDRRRGAGRHGLPLRGSGLRHVMITRKPRLLPVGSGPANAGATPTI